MATSLGRIAVLCIQQVRFQLRHGARVGLPQSIMRALREDSMPNLSAVWTWFRMLRYRASVLLQLENVSYKIMKQVCYDDLHGTFMEQINLAWEFER